MATVVSSSDELTEEMVEKAKAELVETDGVPLESPWHRAEINLLIDQVRCHRRGRKDYFVGGNMFLYYSRRQTKKYRGPEFFLVEDVDGERPRRYWWVYEEDGRFPDLIAELLSPSTAEEDLTTKKDLYETVFRTPEYFFYDPDARRLYGWRLRSGRYEPIEPDANGRLWSEVLQLWLGTWEGAYLETHACWLRFYDAEGKLVPTLEEWKSQLAEEEHQRAEAEHLRAEEERQRAEDECQRAAAARERAQKLAAEVARLNALLAEKGLTPPPTPS